MPPAPTPANPAFGHAPDRDTAVVVVNLGTPEAPDARGVRRYLAEFLGDPRVVQIPRILWLPLLHGVILPLRASRVAGKYREIWMDEGSPLARHTRRLAEEMQARLPGIRVVDAMRYGKPSLADALQTLREDGIARILVLPLYPQYSTTTTASVEDVVARADAAPSMRVIRDYATHAGWVDAIADSIRAHWQAHGRGERLLFSMHGIPQRLVDGGDPYESQCKASVAAIAQALSLGEDDYRLTFQSRFGRERWLLPATDATLRELARDGVRHVDVVCPGFAVDCLETLEEIAMQNAELFREHGGQSLRYIPCLNDSPAHADALAALVTETLDAWA